jgi:hypothetical protein
MRFLASTVVLLCVLGAGLVGGFVAGRQGGSPAVESALGHEHGAHAPVLSERTLANLGVELGEAALSDFVRTVEVPARVEALPGSRRALTTPVAGVVRAVNARVDERVESGGVVAEVVRDAWPQPTLVLTEAIIKPLNEDHHEAAVGVRTAALALALAEAERARLSDLAPATTRVLRDAEYAERRARLELENAVHEAERHGMTAEQIELLRRGEGEIEVPDVPDVRRVLARNRLWSAEADAVLALLPERLTSVPYTLAVLGELVGAGRLTPDLVRALSSSPALATGFLDLAGLVQGGTTPAALVHLAERGGLDPVVRVLAPSGEAPAYDCRELLARPGERVEAGAVVAWLDDDRVVALRLEPAPSDLDALSRALADGATLAAAPLVAGSGPALSEVRLTSLGGSGGALARAQNTLWAEVELAPGRVTRTWALRSGLLYAVRVPLEKRPGRFVLPADAIAYRGAEALVLMKAGAGFTPVPVRLEHHDARVAVVKHDGAIFPGDTVVLRGAPALALALLAGQGGDAGHGHPHPH